MKITIIITTVSAYHFFNNWHCLKFNDPTTIIGDKPYTANIGDLSIVLWRDNTKRIISSLNICPHMGSKLGNGKIIDGCLQCQYHGLQLNEKTHGFGQVIEHQNKIYWSYDPKTKLPPSIPFYENPKYVHSHIVIDMDASLPDCALNTMDIRHPEYVHGGWFSFGSKTPAHNIRFMHTEKEDTISLEFDYSSNSWIQAYLGKTITTHNIHSFQFPSFTWSKVAFSTAKPTPSKMVKPNPSNPESKEQQMNLIIAVDFLPLSPTKTRWFVSVVHNYHTNPIGQITANILARKILYDDFHQLKNQAEPSLLKNRVLFNHIFEDEEAVVELHKLFKTQYKYPDMQMIQEFLSLAKN